MSGNDVDLFQITLTGGRTFSATTEGMADFDTQLFLFDKNGLGVYARDDNPTSLQSTLPASHPLTPVVPEAYYLAIASFNNDPISSRGLIFDNDEFPPYNKVLGPIIPGSEKPLSGFNDLGSGGGSYRIAITGATAVPELSSTLGTLAFGAFAVSWMLKRKLKSRQSAASHNPSKA
ncbi:MAG TPA: DVUA0089 family protein [Candidatus Caenarcaniphilales bacterium]